MMSAPSCASRTAWLRPWPRAAPVMKATLPSSLPICGSSSSGPPLRVPERGPTRSEVGPSGPRAGPRPRPPGSRPPRRRAAQVPGLADRQRLQRRGGAHACTAPRSATASGGPAALEHGVQHRPRGDDVAGEPLPAVVGQHPARAAGARRRPRPRTAAGDHAGPAVLEHRGPRPTRSAAAPRSPGGRRPGPAGRWPSARSPVGPSPEPTTSSGVAMRDLAAGRGEQLGDPHPDRSARPGRAPAPARPAAARRPARRRPGRHRARRAPPRPARRWRPRRRRPRGPTGEPDAQPGALGDQPVGEHAEPLPPRGGRDHRQQPADRRGHHLDGVPAQREHPGGLQPGRPGPGDHDRPASRRTRSPRRRRARSARARCAGRPRS